MTMNADTPTKQTRNLVVNLDDEFRELLPPLTADEYGALEKSILTDKKVREPLLVWKEEGILVDGYNRYKICEKHGIKYRTVEKSFKSREEVKLWMLDNQSGRRNMTGFQQIEVVLKLKDTIAEAAKANQRASGGKAVCKRFDKPIHTYKVLGEKVGTSHTTIRKVEYILDHAGEDDINALRRGEKRISIDAVYKKYKDAAKSAQSSGEETATDETLVSVPKQNSPIIQKKNETAENISGQIDFILDTLDDIDRDCPRQDIRIGFYNRVSEWLDRKRAGLSTEQE